MIDATLPVNPKRAWAPLARLTNPGWCPAKDRLQVASEGPFSLGKVRAKATRETTTMAETRCSDTPHHDDLSILSRTRPSHQIAADLAVAANDRVLRRFTLRIAAGPDAGRTFDLETDGGPAARPLRGGRSELCDLVLGDPRVGDVHFELASQRGQLLVRDLDSAGGLHVGDLRVREAWLAPGAAFRVGHTLLELTAADPVEVPTVPYCHFGDLDGQSPCMRLLFHRLAELAAREDRRHGLFSGEPGTGKTLAAHSFHLFSADRHGPLVTLDVGALTPQRVDAELLGVGPRKGAVASAHGGTLILENIDELSHTAQVGLAKLLRSAPVRVLATSRRDLQRLAAADRFDHGLYRLLTGFQVVLPPLRERARDIAFLAEKFVERLGAAERQPRTLTADALEALRDHTWPGNVRELRFIVERAYFAGSRGPIGRTDLGLGRGPDSGLARVDSLLRTTHDDAVSGFESIYFRHQIDAHRTKIGAARASGMTGEGFRLACRRVRVY